MGLLQKFVRILPKKWTAGIEAESRQWIMTCEKCGRETSVWEAGGVRWKAAGNPVRLFNCPTCGPTAHRLHKQEPETGGTGVPPVTPTDRRDAGPTDPT